MTITANHTATGSPTITSPSGVTYQLVNITPDLAEHWLREFNTHNRSLRQRVVDAYAHDISTNRWLETGDSVKRAADGTVIDGQHRLAAIAKARKPLLTLVVSNLPLAAQEAVDNGAKRTFADVLHLRGETHYNLLAAVVRRVWTWERGERGQKGRWLSPTVSQLLDTLDAHPTIRESVEVAAQAKRGVSINGSVLGLCHWLFNQFEPDDCQWFFDRLRDGAELATTHPVYVLRRTVNENRSAKSRLNEHVVTAYVIKAWNYFRSGREVRFIRFTMGGASPEAFPEPE